MTTTRQSLPSMLLKDAADVARVQVRAAMADDAAPAAQMTRGTGELALPLCGCHAAPRARR
jgi:hypothetical protein